MHVDVGGGQNGLNIQTGAGEPDPIGQAELGGLAVNRSRSGPSPMISKVASGAVRTFISGP